MTSDEQATARANCAARTLAEVMKDCPACGFHISQASPKNQIGGTMQQYETIHGLTKEHEGSFIRLDGVFGNLSKPAKRQYLYKLHRVWSDGGISVRKLSTPQFIRPQFISPSKFNQRVEVYTRDEYDKLPD